MKTVLTKKQQTEWCNSNNSSLKHKWSSRGYGNSKILVGYDDEQIAKRSGCGYDRFGAVLGDVIQFYFQDELNKIAKNHCKDNGVMRKGSEKFYGLFKSNSDGRVYLDGACGSESMRKILMKIGFSLIFHGSDSKSNNGVEFYEIVPITKNDYRWL